MRVKLRAKLFLPLNFSTFFGLHGPSFRKYFENLFRLGEDIAKKIYRCLLLTGLTNAPGGLFSTFQAAASGGPVLG
jgi:hypothetical protein